MILLPQGEETIGRQEGRKEGRTGGREEGQEEGRCVYVLGIWAEVIDLLITRKCYVRSSLYGIQGSRKSLGCLLETGVVEFFSFCLNETKLVAITCY